MEKSIWIVTTDSYPQGDAGAIRQHAFAKMYKQLGYKVFVIGYGESTNFEEKNYDGIEYTSLRRKKQNFINKINGRLLFSVNLNKVVKYKELPNVIMISDIDRKSFCMLVKLSKLNNITVIHDSVEWYSPEQFSFGKLSPTYIRKDMLNRRWLNSPVKVVAISRYLEEHFKSKGINTIYIPVILDVQNISFNKRNNPKKLTFMYAGSVGKKDYLYLMLSGLSMLTQKELDNIEFRIFGITKESAINVDGISKELIDKLDKYVTFYGRVSHSDVLKHLEETDFTLLMRSPKQRYAMAGFPTKVVESLASATPVITNITSNLGDYLKDMQNSIIVEDCSAEAFLQAIRKTFNLTYEQKINMFLQARNTAENYFDYTLYENLMLEFTNN